ncbi:hypothetical protein HNY73_017140 [Argiope bruennichi]|uniref:Uncharacterized protein n=1 Tax=Argiope bruennichi TaxID=94029 RepID=A0A8T0ELY4_ARGBR|nr:hypothetical protein HNY73_017140 [Argiope bruennichi]
MIYSPSLIPCRLIMDQYYTVCMFGEMNQVSVLRHQLNPPELVYPSVSRHKESILFQEIVPEMSLLLEFRNIRSLKTAGTYIILIVYRWFNIMKLVSKYPCVA